MKNVKDILNVIIGEKNIQRFRNFIYRRTLRRDFLTDYKLYKKHSSVFKKNTYNKIESEITLRYHSLEKGFLYNPIKYRFAKTRVIELISYIKLVEVTNHINEVQIQSAILNLCKYYEIHIENGVNISDYYSQADYDSFKKKLLVDYQTVSCHTASDYFKFRQSSFDLFSVSRHSVRNFSGEKISVEVIQNVVDLANHAPSVCNRQGVFVNLIENKNIIDQILEIHGGLKGYSEKISQLIILTSDRNYFYSVGERHQLYIDGGIYLMNLLYALHYYEITACPAHWGMPNEYDFKVQEIVGLNESEKIICLIAIGKPNKSFKTTLSLRRTHKENLRIQN